MTTSSKEKLIVILGPTASGKTRLSVRLAKEIRTSIVSGDSMLVYRGCDIGSAKPEEQEREGVYHALIDIVDPTDSDFNVTEFQRLAETEIHEMNAKGLIPILVGGTGLYLKALIEGYHFNKSNEDKEYREALYSLAQMHGNDYVHKMLEKVDPETAARLHTNDFRRVVRALEVWHSEKERISQEKKSTGLIYDACVIGLQCDRQFLYNQIEKRVESMISSGLELEVRRLLQKGVSRNARAMQGIGYKEMAAYIAGECGFAETVDNIKKATRHFAKRQCTWYRKMPYIQWIQIDQLSFEEIVEESLRMIKRKFQ